MRWGRAARLVSAATITLVFAATAVPIATASESSSTSSTLSLESEPGHAIGRGESISLTSESATIEVTGDASAIDVTATNGDGTIGVQIDAPTGIALGAGTFALAAPASTEAAAVTVTRDGQSCTAVDGSLTISDLTIDESGSVTSLATELTHRCDSAEGPALRVSIEHAVVAPQPETPETTVPPTTTPPTTAPAPEVPEIAVTQGDDVSIAETFTNSLIGGYRHQGDTRFYRYSPSCTNQTNVLTCPIFLTTLSPPHPGDPVWFTVQLKIKKGWQRLFITEGDPLDSNSQSLIVLITGTKSAGKTYRIRAEWEVGSPNHVKGKYRYFKITHN